MKICIINPNSDLGTQLKIEQVAKKLEQEGDRFDTVSMTRSPKLIQNAEEQLIAGIEMREFITAHEQAYDAFIVACHADPQLPAMKLATSKIVIGIAEASMKLATFEGSDFGVISPSEKSALNKARMSFTYGVDRSCHSFRVSRSDEAEAVLKAGRQLVEGDFCDAVILGCANYAGLDGRLEQELRVPVFDGVAAGILLAKLLQQYHDYKKEMILKPIE